MSAAPLAPLARSNFFCHSFVQEDIMINRKKTDGELTELAKNKATKKLTKKQRNGQICLAIVMPKRL